MERLSNTPDRVSPESKDVVENRKHGWARLRNFALTASLLVNGGLVANQLDTHWETARFNESTEAGGTGWQFSLENGRGAKGDFDIYDRGDGVKILQGKFNRDGNEYDLVFHLPKGLDLEAEAKRLGNSRAPAEVISQMIDLANFGEVTVDSPEGNPVYSVSFGDATGDGRETIGATETFFDSNGKFLRSQKTSLGNVEKGNLGQKNSGVSEPRNKESKPF